MLRSVNRRDTLQPKQIKKQRITTSNSNRTPMAQQPTADRRLTSLFRYSNKYKIAPKFMETW